MTESVPKHLFEKFSRLYYATDGKNFTHKEAQKILNITSSYAGQVLPALVRAGWLSSKRNDSDHRLKEYSFCDPCTVIKEIGKKLERN